MINTERIRLACLISGRGTNMANIVKACNDGRLPIDIACVISSKKNVPGIEVARQLGVRNIEVVNFLDETKFERRLLEVLEDNDVNLVGQYGWWRKTPKDVVKKYWGRIIGHHPGPVDPGRPGFGGQDMFGKRIHAARLYFVRKTEHDYWTEATAIKIYPEYDEGPAIKVERIEIQSNDTPEILEARVLEAEYRIGITTLEDFISDRVQEIHRETPLIRLEEAEILDEAKIVAAILYPHG